jgi:predicted DNA-binding transcriptional regulator YafY
MSRTKAAGISDKVIRLLDIYVMIAQKKYPSVPSLADRLGVSERTIFRYLEIINTIDSIDFDPERRGYGFTRGDRTRMLSLKKEELMILLAEGEAVSHLGESLGESFQGLVGRITAAGRRPAGAKTPIMVKMPDAAGASKGGPFFTTLCTCVDERRSVEITYHARHTGETTKRIIDPYGLVFYDGAWIVVGYCHLRKQIRSFAFDRILEMKERNLYFTPREGFNLDDYFARSWGIFDDKEVKVTLRFTPEVADYVLRIKWHPSERRKTLPGGGLEVSYRVAGVAEIKRWIYSWLPNVEVVKPKWFRDQVKAELATAAKAHTGSP